MSNNFNIALDLEPTNALITTVDTVVDDNAAAIFALNDIDAAGVTLSAITALNTLFPGTPTAGSPMDVMKMILFGGLAVPPSIYPSDDLIHSNDTEISAITVDIYTKFKEIICTVNGLIRVVYDHQQFSAAGVTSRIYKNGAVHGTEQGEGGTGWATVSEDLYFNSGDSLELWAKRTTATGAISLRNLRLYGVICPKMTNSITG